MRAFSQLLDDLVYTRSRNTKLKLIGDYLKATPDPDRGIALAALTGTLDIPHAKPAALRGLVEERISDAVHRAFDAAPQFHHACPGAEALGFRAALVVEHGCAS